MALHLREPGLAVHKVGTHLAHLCVLRAEHRAWCPGVTKLVTVERRTERLLHLEVFLLHIHSRARMPLQIRGLAKGSALWDCWVSQVWTCHGQNGQLRAASSGAAGQAVQTRGAGLGWVRESQGRLGGAVERAVWWRRLSGALAAPGVQHTEDPLPWSDSGFQKVLPA